MQDYGQARGDCSRHAADLRCIDSTLLQAFERDGAERIFADAGLESYFAAECGQVVGNDRRRRSECQHHAVSKQFALWSELLRESVENKVQVQFAGYRDIESGHDVELAQLGMVRRDGPTPFPSASRRKTPLTIAVPSHERDFDARLLERADIRFWRGAVGDRFLQR